MIKEFDVPLAHVPEEGWMKGFGGKPRPYDANRLSLGNHWSADSFEHGLAVVADSLP